MILGGVAAALAASRFQGDEAVMDEIDKHFETVALITSNDDDESGVTRYATSSEIPPRSGFRTGSAADPEKRKAYRRKPRRSESFETGSRDRKDGGKKSTWKGVRKVAPGTYEIDAKLVASARKNPRKYIRSAGAVPVQKEGRLIGFRILGVREGDPLYVLGLRDGDVLTSVNGYTLDSAENAALAASTLRFADKYRVDLLRGDGTRSFYYRVGKEAPEKSAK